MTFDLAAVAKRHAVRHVRLDLDAIDVRETLSIGDVVDMARVLGVAPEEMAIRLAPDGHIANDVALDVSLALAWVIGRKAEPDLDWETVRATWRLEVPEIGTRNPTPARRKRTARVSVPATSSD
jgi:hypothetical protein